MSIDPKLVKLDVEPGTQPNSYSVSVSNKNKSALEFTLNLINQPEWVKSQGDLGKFLVATGDEKPKQYEFTLQFDPGNMAGSYNATLQLSIQEVGAVSSKDFSFNFNVDLRGGISWTLVPGPGGPDGEASFQVTMTSELNAPVRATLGPNSGELKFTLDPAMIEIGADALPREATATLRVTQDHFKELTSNVIVPFQFEYMKKDPAAEGGEKRGKSRQ